MAKNFKDLSERQIPALAISLEETDARVYADFAAGLKADYPTSAQIFTEMEAEEDGHRSRLIEEYRRRFGEHIPLIRREDLKGFVHRKPVWMIRPLGIKTVRRQAETMETETGVSTSALLIKSVTRQRGSYWETWRRRSGSM